jgi:hypothetical protein
MQFFPNYRITLTTYISKKVIDERLTHFRHEYPELAGDEL